MQLELQTFKRKFSNCIVHIWGHSDILGLSRLDGLKFSRMVIGSAGSLHYDPIEIRGALVINDACCITLQFLCSQSDFFYLGLE